MSLHLIPFITTNDPFETFSVPSLALNRKPLLCRAPRDIKFLFNSGKYLTSNRILSTIMHFDSDSSSPATLQDLLLPRSTSHAGTRSKVSNQSLFGDT